MDNRKRALEREAASGSIEAKARLLQERMRMGERSLMPCVVCLGYSSDAFGTCPSCGECNRTGTEPLSAGIHIASIVGDASARLAASLTPIDKAQLAQIDKSIPRFADVLTAGPAWRNVQVAGRAALAAARCCTPRYMRNVHAYRTLMDRLAACEDYLLGEPRRITHDRFRTFGGPALGVDVEFVLRDVTALSSLLTDAVAMVKENDFTGDAAGGLVREAIKNEVAPWALGVYDPVLQRHEKRKRGHP